MPVQKKSQKSAAAVTKITGGKPPLRGGHPYKETGRSNYVFISCEYKLELSGDDLKIFEDKVADLYHTMVPHKANESGEFRHPWVRIIS